MGPTKIYMVCGSTTGFIDRLGLRRRKERKERGVPLFAPHSPPLFGVVYLLLGMDYKPFAINVTSLERKLVPVLRLRFYLKLYFRGKLFRTIFT